MVESELDQEIKGRLEKYIAYLDERATTIASYSPTTGSYLRAAKEELYKIFPELKSIESKVD